MGHLNIQRSSGRVRGPHSPLLEFFDTLLSKQGWQFPLKVGSSKIGRRWGTSLSAVGTVLLLGLLIFMSWGYLKVKVTQSCLTLCNPMDCSLPGFSVHGILQARTLEWVAISFSRGSSQPRYRTQVSCIAGGFFTIWATRSPKMLEWEAYPFSRGSSGPRNRTGVSSIAGRFFTIWVIYYLYT